MNVIVVGLGVQGYKRRKFAGDDFVAAVDPINPEADYKHLRDVPVADYDAALCCIPDEPKIDVLTYLMENGKHALVEKPLWGPREGEIQALEALARSRGMVCYTAYNHRFEPHFVRMRELLNARELGKIYRCRMFYGNGTAGLVRDSDWRDQGAGVLPDLASHLLDVVAFWFGPLAESFRVTSASCFENRAPDHVVLANDLSDPTVELEMTLLMWRNDFTCDILAENGSAHIRSLCKWGPSTFVKRTRVRPSGRPPEESLTLVQDDPTWALEYAYFKELCRTKPPADLSHDVHLNRIIRQLSEEALGKCRP